MEKEKKKLKKINVNIIGIIISIVICFVGILFLISGIDKSNTAVGVKERDGGTITGLGYATTYGADFYTEASKDMIFIGNATKEIYYLLEKCFGILLIIIGIFNILHNCKQLNKGEL